MRILVGGNVQKILDLLSAGSCTLSDIQAEMRAAMPATLLATIEKDVMKPLVEEAEYVIYEEDLYFITETGRTKLAWLREQTKLRKAEEQREKVKANLVHSSGTYDGKELALTAVRPGAMDYRKHPSIINGKRIYNV